MTKNKSCYIQLFNNIRYIVYRNPPLTNSTHVLQCNESITQFKDTHVEENKKMSDDGSQLILKAFFLYKKFLKQK